MNNTTHIQVGQRLGRSCGVVAEVCSIYDFFVYLRILQDDGKVFGSIKERGITFPSSELYSDLDWSSYSGKWYLLEGQEASK